MNQTDSISSHAIPSFIQTNIPLSDKNWFKTGGSAAFFAEPRTPEEFAQSLHYAHKASLPVFILGQGANILVSDEGFEGLVIRPKMTEISILSDDRGLMPYQVQVTAGAGVTMHELIEWCLSNNITGLEEFSGIPGTVGGSVFINLHYFEFLLEHFIQSARVIEKKSGTLMTVDKEWFQFGYDYSKLCDGEHYLASATFTLKHSTPLETAYAQGRRAEIIRHREKRYPSKNTCGSFFRNFHEHEVTLKSNGRSMTFVAYYLDKIGVKGALQHGGAMVSWQHANMIVNTGNATSADIIAVAREMQNRVFETFGIIPQPECLLIGFKEWPLMKL